MVLDVKINAAMLHRVLKAVKSALPECLIERNRKRGQRLSMRPCMKFDLIKNGIGLNKTITVIKNQAEHLHERNVVRVAFRILMPVQGGIENLHRTAMRSIPVTR